MKKSKAKSRGGARAGAGRKTAGTKAYLVRMKPGTMERIKALAGCMTPGQFLDMEFPERQERWKA